MNKIPKIKAKKKKDYRRKEKLETTMFCDLVRNSTSWKKIGNGN